MVNTPSDQGLTCKTMDNLLDWNSFIGFVFGGGVTSLIQAWFAKRKAKAEAKSSELDNAQKIINMQDEFINKQSERHAEEKKEWSDKYTELQTRIVELEKKLSNHMELQDEVIALTKKVQHLEFENGKLKKEIQKLKDENVTTRG